MPANAIHRIQFTFMISPLDYANTISRPPLIFSAGRPDFTSACVPVASIPVSGYTLSPAASRRNYRLS